MMMMTMISSDEEDDNTRPNKKWRMVKGRWIARPGYIEITEDELLKFLLQ